MALSFLSCGSASSTPADGALPAGLEKPAASLAHGGSVMLRFGTQYPEGSCFTSSMTIRFINNGPGTYVANEAQRTCIADAGVGFPCLNEMVAKFGTATGVGTMKLTGTTTGMNGTFEGEASLAFDLGSEKRDYAFSFVAPICAME
jgi:hypothetical protein